MPRQKCDAQTQQVGTQLRIYKCIFETEKHSLYHYYSSKNSFSYDKKKFKDDIIEFNVLVTLSVLCMLIIVMQVACAAEDLSIFTYLLCIANRQIDRRDVCFVMWNGMQQIRPEVG